MKVVIAIILAIIIFITGQVCGTYFVTNAVWSDIDENSKKFVIDNTSFIGNKVKDVFKSMPDEELSTYVNCGKNYNAKDIREYLSKIGEFNIVGVPKGEATIEDRIYTINVFAEYKAEYISNGERISAVIYLEKDKKTWKLKNVTYSFPNACPNK